MIINIICFIVGVGLPYLAEEYAYRRLRSGNAQTDAGSPSVSRGYGLRIVWDVAYFFVVLASGYRLIFSNAPLTWFEWLGQIAFLGGIMLRIWSLRALGQFYDSGIAIRSDHQLVRNGPYRTLRHPLHLGTLLKIIGLAFFSPAWLGIAAVFSSLALAIQINRTEDLIHLQRFGSSFKDYHRSTWDIVDLFFWKHKPDQA
jgi:protein-S-isoprenylcysteine O-methyltransferase Ste14